MRTQQNTREYMNIIEDLKTALNSRGRNSKNKHEQVLSYIREFNLMGFEISKTFLKNLYNSENKKNRTKSLNLLLSKMDYLVLKQNTYFKEIEFKKFKAKSKSFKNYLYSSQNNYVKSFNVGKIYTLKKQKAYKFLCFDLNKINQKQKQYKNMFLRSLNLYPEFVLSYFFKLNE